MSKARHAFTPPRHPLLQWLTDPGKDLSPQIRSSLLGELFTSPKAVIAGLINGVILNGTAIYLCGHGLLSIFGVFAIIDTLLVVLRFRVVRNVMRAAEQGKPTPTGSYLITAGAWCALQGTMAFAAMLTDILPLQILAATTVMGLVGPLSARNYAAPRYAMMLIILCDLPFVTGAALSGNRWLLILLLQTPLFMYGVHAVITRFQSIAIATMQAEEDNYHRARHDPLTGLLNRLGLNEALAAHYKNSSQYILFYLDLDGFKPINDTFGHDAGDKVLQAVATRLNTCVRTADIVARFGGDEFVIVAADMSAVTGTSFAENIITRIGSEPYTIATVGSLRVGVSVGFACAPEDGLIGDDLHPKADAALYEAKEAGRGTHRRFVPIRAALRADPMLA